MNQELRPYLMILISCLLLAVGCGASRNPRMRQVGSGFRGFNELSNKAIEQLKNRMKLITIIDLERPKLGEEIEYLVEYNLVRNLTFFTPNGKCSYQYSKVKLKESIIEENSILKIHSSSLSVSPEYIGLPIQDLKAKCDQEVVNFSIASAVREIDLGRSLNRFKNLISGQVFAVVDKCETRSELKDGKCINLEMNVSREIETIFQDFTVYKVRSKIRYPKINKEYFSIFQLTRPYFKFYGLIYLGGGMPLGGIDPQNEIKSLEVLRWVQP
jgi:hypothetical protein